MLVKNIYVIQKILPLKPKEMPPSLYSSVTFRVSISLFLMDSHFSAVRANYRPQRERATFRALVLSKYTQRPLLESR